MSPRRLWHGMSPIKEIVWYVQAWRTIMVGRPWEIAVRRQHRSIATVLGLVLLYWAVSGLSIALYDVTDSAQVWAAQGGGPGARLVEITRPLAPPQTLAAGITAALRTAQPMAVASADLRLVGGVPRLQLGQADGNRATLRRFYAISGKLMPDAIADQTVPPANTELRNTIKAFHKGDAYGLAGQIVGLIAGLGLLTMTLTGLRTYIPLLRARRRLGRNGLFWVTKNEPLRQYHRWIAVVAAAFLLNIALTGIVLAAAEIQLNLFLHYHVGSPPYPRPTPLPAMSDAPIKGDILTLFETAYTAAAHTGHDVRAITLINRQGSTRALITVGGAQPQIIALDPVSGKSVRDWATGGFQRGNGYFGDWHQMVKRMHRGDIVGTFAGRYMDITAGLALFYLTASGLLMVRRMVRQRRAAGRPGWFWK